MIRGHVKCAARYLSLRAIMEMLVFVRSHAFGRLLKARNSMRALLEKQLKRERTNVGGQALNGT
jgi:hypothetical protein